MILEQEEIREIDTLAEKIWSINRTDPQNCKLQAEELIARCEKLNYANGKTYALAALGASQVWLSNYDEALKNLFQSREELKILSNRKLEAEVVYHIFCCFYFLADYNHAIEYANQILVLSDETGDMAAKANAYNGIGTIYYTVGENKKAISNLSKGLAIAEKLSDKPLLARILDGMGTALYQNGDLEKAITYKEKSFAAAKDSGLKNVEGYAVFGLAKIYSELKKNDLAEKFYLQSIHVRKEVNFKPGIAESLSSLGNLYFTMGEKEKAFDLLTQALSVAEEIDSKEYLYKTHQVLAQYFEEKNQIDLFKKHFELYFVNKEKYNAEKNRQKLKSAEMQMKMAQVEKEKELLEKKHRELENYSRDLELLSNLGKKITSQISVESINKTVYEILNTIMDATGFGIGIVVNQGKNLEFPGYIEDGEVFKSSMYDLSDDNRMAVICFSKELEILITDFDNESSKYVKRSTAPVVGKHVQSLIYLPLRSENKKLGVITIQSFTKNAYSEYHLNLLRNLAVYCAIAIENASSYEKLEEIVEERTKEVKESNETTKLLNNLGREITALTKFEEIFRKLYHSVSQLMDAGCFGVRLYNTDKDIIEYRFEIEKGVMDQEVFTVPMSNDNNYSVWCVKNKEAIFINDNITEHKKWVKEIHVVTGDMPHSLLFQPMMIGEKVLGVISVQSFERHAYQPHHLDILKTLANYTAIAIENANLINHLEDRVKERTREIEKTFANTKMISEIGKEISALLSAKDIISKLYSSVNTLLDATIFGVAVYRSEENDLFFSGAIEKGEALPDFSFPLDEDKISTVCFQQKREVIINDWSNEYHNYISKNYTATQGAIPESMIYLPLISKGQIIGVITVQSFAKNAYQNYHVDILRSLSVYVGSALENANLYKSLEIKVKERTAEIEKAYQDTKLIGQIAKDITSSLSVETIIEKVYHSVNKLMDATGFGIGIFNPHTQQIRMPGYIEKGDKLEDFYYDINDDRLATWCFRNKKEIFINDYTIEYTNYIKGLKKPIAGKDSASIIYIPLFLKEEVMGILTIQSFEKNVYTEYHMDILRNLATSIASALDNARLYENMEAEVHQRTAEVIKQKEIIEEKNKHITDSIIYAKRIQEAILPPEETFFTHLKNSFVLYKPKDIVSGDFYWIERKGPKVLFAVVDCTGHGVPGAFMSIIGYNGLNQIVNEYNITEPAEILNRLNKIITQTLKQRADESKIRDGMDISVCCIDFEHNKLEFAGANNPIFIVRNKQVIEVKADKHPIGNFVGEDEFHFSNNEISLFKDDCLYLFSDGYADQFGGPRGKKLKYTQFRDLLLEHHQKPMRSQKELLDFMFEEWRGDLEQIDDVCVIGVKVG